MRIGRPYAAQRLTRPRARGRSSVFLAASLLWLGCLSVGCAKPSPYTLDDLETAMRVKTAILNDPVVGTEDVRVEAVSGMVYLTGAVSSPDHRQRLLEIARQVRGVRDVQLSVDINPELAVLERRIRPASPDDDTAPRRWFAVGATVRFTSSPSGEVEDVVDVTPITRIGWSDGFHPSVGLGWTSRSLLERVEESPALATVKMRPVMGGVEWRRTVGRSSLSLGLVAGYSFNALDLDDSEVAPFRAVNVSDAFVWRPSASLWFDLTDRIGLQTSIGYTFARPEVTYASEATTITRTIDAGALMVSIGGAYWIF